MKITAFAAAFLPETSKSALKKALDDTKKELKQETLSQYHSASQSGFDKRKWKSPSNVDLQKAFDNVVKTKHRGNMVAVLTGVLEDMESHFPAIEKLYDDYFANDIVREAITFMGANIIQFQEALSFVTRYSRKLLIKIITDEVIAADPEQLDDRAILPGELKYLAEKRNDFFTALNMVANTTKSIVEKIENIPDVVPTEKNSEQIAAVMGFARLDPFKFNLISAKLNPIFYIRKWIVEAQVKAYKEAEEERLMLECRIMQLKNADAGKNDPKLQAAIKHNEGRLQRLQGEIAEMVADDE